MLNNLNNYDNEDIITKSQMYEKLQPDKVLGDSFAKTINYHGIHSNFCLDIPEIIEEEKKQQERREDIAKFTKLMISDFDNDSDKELVAKLLADNEILADYTDNILTDLSHNSELLNDLGL